MYSSSSSGRRSLMRPYSSHNGPAFRNLPLFLFLTGLVLFFYVFYIYQAQNAELSLAKEQNDYKDVEVRKLNDQMTDLKVQLEKLKSQSETALDSANKEKSNIEDQFKNCSSIQSKLESKVTQLEEEKKDYAEKLQTVKAQLEQLNDTLSAMRVVNKNNEETIMRLNGTIAELQNQLHKPQPAANFGIAESSKLNHTANTAAVNHDAVQQRILDARGRISQIENSNLKNEEQINRNVGPAPAVLNNGDAFGDRRIENEEEGAGEKNKKEDAAAEDTDHVLVDADDARILAKKDYRNSAEENELRIQENQLKPKEDPLAADNFRKV